MFCATGSLSGLLATSVMVTPVRSAARHRMSLITTGQASASPQICIRPRFLPRRLAVPAADPQFLPDHAYFLQASKDILGHALGQIDETVIVTDIHLSDVPPLEPRLVGDRANDVTGLHAMHVPDLEAEGFKHNTVVVAALAA